MDGEGLTGDAGTFARALTEFILPRGVRQVKHSEDNSPK